MPILRIFMKCPTCPNMYIAIEKLNPTYQHVLQNNYTVTNYLNSLKMNIYIK